MRHGAAASRSVIRVEGEPAPVSTPEAHWGEVFRTKDVTAVSWYQADPVMSLRLLSEVVPRPRSVIDVGAGASVLVDALLDADFEDLTVLDVSDRALTVVRDRLADRAQQVAFVVADLLTWMPERQWDAWHDRAVFHFLVDPHDRAAYVTTASGAVGPGGVVVVGSFALDGPDRCSGLATARYDAASLADQFGEDFRLERAEREVHHTPGGADQAFTWAVLRRR